MERPKNATSRFGGVVHTYRGYDPQHFPMPAAQAPDLVTPAFNHMMAYGHRRNLSPEELAEAIEIDPSQISGLGPSLSQLLAMLEERKRRILETYETDTVRKEATNVFNDAAASVKPPRNLDQGFDRAVKSEQIVDFEKLWYGVDQRSDFARSLVKIMDQLGNKYQIEELAAKYAFIGRTAMSISEALEVKEELETIDRLIKQLEEAAKNAKLYVINLEELARFASEEQVEGLEQLQRQVDEMLRHLAEQQGLQLENGQYKLTPKAYKIFQSKLLDEIFSDLQAARTGRHQVAISGEGAVELQRTKTYEFGDSLANMDVVSSLTNAMIREGEFGESSDKSGGPRQIRLTTDDIVIHHTRNTPKCATAVCMDMSGSMRWNAQYVNVKRMALALHGLIRTEYPGDFIDFVEVATLPKRRHISEVPQLLPKPVTIYDPVVRLKADMSDPQVSEIQIPPHFTNIQRGLALARQMLQVQDTPNRQIMLITDGLPTAHFEANWLYMLYPPDPRTEKFTMKEALLCRQQGITINIFLLSSWSQSEEDIQFAYRMAESTQGRVFFVGGRELDRFVVWDYLRRRRFIVG